jgi:hypothetical protein
MLLGRDAAPASVVRSHVPGRHSGSLTRALRPGQVRHAEKGECPNAAVARRLARRMGTHASDPSATDHSRSNSGGPASNPGHASSRRAIPLDGGGKRDGLTPCPDQARGQHGVGCPVVLAKGAQHAHITSTGKLRPHAEEQRKPALVGLRCVSKHGHTGDAATPVCGKSGPRHHASRRAPVGKGRLERSSA